MARFSPSDEETLTKLVQKYPPIYDPSIAAYKDAIIRDCVWKEIATTMNKTEEACKKKWRNLRDSYIRLKRKQRLPKDSSSMEKIPKWPLYKHLMFIDAVRSEHYNTTNTCDSESTSSSQIEENSIQIEKENHLSEYDNTDSEKSFDEKTIFQEPGPSTKQNRVHNVSGKKKRKEPPLLNDNDFLDLLKEREERRQEMLITATNINDPIESFCHHIKSVLENLPPVLMLKAKSDIFNIVLKYELEAANSASGQLSFCNPLAYSPSNT